MCIPSSAYQRPVSIDVVVITEFVVISGCKNAPGSFDAIEAHAHLHRSIFINCPTTTVRIIAVAMSTVLVGVCFMGLVC